MTIFIGRDPDIATTGNANFGNMQFFRNRDATTGNLSEPLTGPGGTGLPDLTTGLLLYPTDTLFYLSSPGFDGGTGQNVPLGTYVSTANAGLSNTWVIAQIGNVVIERDARIYRYVTGNDPNNDEAVSFGDNFDADFPATLVVDRINQTSDQVINLDRVTLIFESGTPTLGNNTSIFANADNASPTWNITDCYIGCTNELINGFGNATSYDNDIINGEMSNVRFFGTGASTWFVNLAGTDDNFAVSNITYNQSAVHNNASASFIQNSNFDGTVRPLGGNNVHTSYTVRIVNNPNVYTISHNNRFDGTNYSDNANEAGADNIIHYETNQDSAHTLYSINNLYENNVLAFAVSNPPGGRPQPDLTVIEGYTWNVALRDAGSSMRIDSDLHLLGLPSTLSELARRVPTVINTESEWQPTAITEIANPSGYFIIEGTTRQNTPRRSATVTRSLNYATSVMNGVTQDQLMVQDSSANDSITGKSYTHIVDNLLLTPQVNQLSGDVTGNGSVVAYTQEHTITASAEDFANTLNSQSFADARALTAITTFDDLYPAIKSQWVLSEFAHSLPIVKNGTILTFNAQLNINESVDPATVPVVVDQGGGLSSITMHSDAVNFGLGSVAVTELMFTRNSTVDVTLNKSGAVFTASNPDGLDPTINLAGTTSSGPLTLATGTFTDLGVANESYHDLTLDNVTVQIEAPTIANQPLNLTDAWGTVTLVGTNTIQAENSPDGFEWSITGAPNGLVAGANVVLSTTLTATGLPLDGSPRLSVFSVGAGGFIAVNASPVHTFVSDGVATNIPGLGTNRFVTVYTSDSAIPEVREYEVVPNGNVDLIVTNIDDALRLTPDQNILTEINDPTSDIDITSIEFITAGVPSSGLRVRTKGFGNIAGVAGQSFLFGSRLRNTEEHHRAVINVIQLPGTPNPSSTNIYNNSDQRITFNGSSFILVDDNFFILPANGAASQQVAVLDRANPNNLAIFGSYTVVDSDDVNDIQRATVETTPLSTAAIDYARIGLVFDAANAEAFSEQLDKIERISSYLVSDGNPTTPGPTDALLGIKPKQGGYVNTVPYEDGV